MKKNITKDNLLEASPNVLNQEEQVMQAILKRNPDLSLEEAIEALDELP